MTRTSANQRTTEVVSVSLAPDTYRLLESTRRELGQSRSSLVALLLKRYYGDELWRRIYRQGIKTAKRFRIKSEKDIEKILNEKT